MASLLGFELIGEVGSHKILENISMIEVRFASAKRAVVLDLSLRECDQGVTGVLDHVDSTRNEVYSRQSSHRSVFKLI